MCALNVELGTAHHWPSAGQSTRSVLGLETQEKAPVRVPGATQARNGPAWCTTGPGPGKSRSPACEGFKGRAATRNNERMIGDHTNLVELLFSAGATGIRVCRDCPHRHSDSGTYLHIERMRRDHTPDRGRRAGG